MRDFLRSLAVQPSSSIHHFQRTFLYLIAFACYGIFYSKNTPFELFILGNITFLVVVYTLKSILKIDSHKIKIRR